MAVLREQVSLSSPKKKLGEESRALVEWNKVLMVEEEKQDVDWKQPREIN